MTAIPGAKIAVEEFHDFLLSSDFRARDLLRLQRGWGVRRSDERPETPCWSVTGAPDLSCGARPCYMP